jgi:hypothetical protein
VRRADILSNVIKSGTIRRLVASGLSSPVPFSLSVSFQAPRVRVMHPRSLTSRRTGGVGIKHKAVVYRIFSSSPSQICVCEMCIQISTKIQQWYLALLQDHSTCFGHSPCPSSGVQ